MTVGADGDQAVAWAAAEAMDIDRTARVQRADQIGVAVQQYVHTGPRDEVVQPDAAPGRAHELIGQLITGARPPRRRGVPSTYRGLPR